MKRREELQVNVAGLRRNIKNLAHNYSDAQVKVREATSNDHWGPSSTLMSEIADLTYNVVAFTEIMQMIWKRLNDHGKNWRHVYKALLLLEYLIKTGSEKVAHQCKENIYAIQTLRDFQYTEDGKDPGLNVREKAKQLGLLLNDEERLKNERARALKAKERFAQAASAFGSDIAADRVFTPISPQSTGSGSRGETWNSCNATDSPPKVEVEFARPQTEGEEELQLQLALAMSREEAEQEEQKRKSDDVRLQLALSESEKEFKQAVQPTSHLADLIDIIPHMNSNNNQPPLIDPWGVPISAPTTMAPSIPQSNYDQWNSVTSSPSTSSAPTPTSHSVTPNLYGSASSDPWAPTISTNTTTISPRTNDDPWRAVSPKVDELTSSLPLGTINTNINMPELNGGLRDPWAPQTSTSTISANILDDDFASIVNRNASKTNGNTKSADVFDLTTLDYSLDLTADSNKKLNNLSLQHNSSTNACRKTPQSFLGENSSLVNLDKLITTPVVPPLPITAQKTGNANPFGGISTTVNASTGNSSLTSNTYTSSAPAFQGDPFQPVQLKPALPQPLLPQPNPFLS